MNKEYITYQAELIVEMQDAMRLSLLAILKKEDTDPNIEAIISAAIVGLMRDLSKAGAKTVPRIVHMMTKGE